MQHDAERAVVAVGIDGVNVRNLRDGKKREQSQTQEGRDAELLRRMLAVAFALCPECRQEKRPLTLRIHRLDAQTGVCVPEVMRILRIRDKKRAGDWLV
jgi:hypothetical protein